MSTADVMAEVLAERVRQDARWGEQNHHDGTGPDTYVQRTWTLSNEQAATYARQACDDAFAEGQGTWRHILDEEVAEAYAAPNTAELRAELIQVAAVAVNWIEAIDRRTGPLRLECGSCGCADNLPADFGAAVDAGWRANDGTVMTCPACAAADDQIERQTDEMVDELAARP